ncbi:uncharacterized protein BX663DRAFT_550205 [Cokeromyces recurvatus]|uniref:uncharacterized protein n=1 Tax=Cokeromyces recurvatus TaxID=90255 RepID=UPI00222013A5|nr:uncharacterized protein BX663DRAFT_550205 [Cokeromyces recurvatus]KAI7904531.1 hypothetical protein BX663DRAFT_550205 [Cokeromyces recurvatus]
MEFDEVNERLNNRKTTVTDSTVNNNISSFSNPFNSILSFQQPVVTTTRKPSLSSFVHKLKQQSSKTRFIRDYKRIITDNNEEGSFVKDDDDDASLRIIDPIRDTSNHHVEIAQSDNKKEESKIKKRVHINENANQIQSLEKNPSFISNISFNEPPKGDLTIDRFISLDEAVYFMKNNIESIQDEIEREMIKIRLKQEEIIRYTDDLDFIQSQLESLQYTLTTNKDLLLRDMVLQRESSLVKNEMKIKANKKRYYLQIQRLLKYYNRNNTIIDNVDRCLVQLERKIKNTYKRDEVWTSIRDWGFLTVLLFSLIIMTFLVWYSGGY